MKPVTKLYLLVLLLVFGACQEQNTTKKVVLVFDRTDSSLSILNLQTDYVINKIISNNQKIFWHGIIVETTSICDSRVTPKHRFQLAYESEYSGNEMGRLVLIEGISKSLTDEIEKYKRFEHSKPYSFVLEKLNLEIEDYLNDSVPTTIYMFSDLHQNSPKHSVYKKDQISQFVIDSILSFDTNTIDLNGLNIHLIHESNQASEDEIFYDMSHKIKSSLERKGAKVFIQASL
ncbi:MAG: hypothetical protein SGJ00_11345 [bacterium]|nr:hypothetical protein [bacterium]